MERERERGKRWQRKCTEKKVRGGYEE